MRALILAAGRGSRMGAATQDRPKCLVPLAGKPLLDWQLAALRQAGIREIAIVRGYQAEAIQNHSLVFFDNPRWAETNMVSTMLTAARWIETGSCLLAYADIVYHPNVVGALAATRGNIVISYDRHWRALWEERFENPLADAETFRAAPDGRLLEIGARAASLDDIQGQYMGLLKFSPAGWQQIAAFLGSLSEKERDKLDMTTLLQRLLHKGVRIDAAPVDGRWCEVDNEQDRDRYESRLQQAEAWTHDWR